MAAHNVKPAKNPKPHHRGGTIRQIQPITYIIGINKLGTLLSSQTTDTPGTTQTNVQDRSGATFQTYPLASSESNRRFSSGPACGFRIILPTRSGERRGNKLYHYIGRMPTAPTQRRGRPGIPRDSGPSFQ